MIQAIIFDFGDIFINLNIDDCKKAFEQLQIPYPSAEIQELNESFEKGELSENQFLEGIQRANPNASLEEIKKAWNTVLGNFPLSRLEFLQMLCGKYRLFLLTNTDQIHIAHFEEQLGESFAGDFYRCFEKVFYSYELGMRKPNIEIFNHIIRTYDLSPKRTLFIDDKLENTNAAKEAGLHVWNLQVGQEDVTELFEKKFVN